MKTKHVLLYKSIFIVLLVTFYLSDSTHAQEVSCESESQCAQLCQNRQAELQAEASSGAIWSCTMKDAGGVEVSGPEDDAEIDSSHQSFTCTCTKLVTTGKKRERTGWTRRPTCY